MLKRRIKNILTKLYWYSMKQYNAFSPSPIRIVWERASEESADFISQHVSTSMLYHDKRMLWSFALSQAINDGLYIECGVYNGNSINQLAQYNPDKQFYGFDSFEGLTENWTGHHKSKGAFNLKGELPKVKNNVHLIKGVVEKTYVPFLEKKQESISFLHIDTDTYAPASFILKASKPYLKSNTIIVFDELIGYPNWQHGEFKALQENFREDEYEFIAFANTQAVIKII